MDKHLEYLNQLDKNEIDNFKRTWIHNLVTMKWLKSRHVEKAKKQYLFFPEELHKHYEINELFRGFDADQSEGIDIQELISMFKDNKIQLDRQDVESIFKIIDFNGDHTLNLSEFKKSVFSDDINFQFSKVMRELREKIDKKGDLENDKNQQGSIILENKKNIQKQNKQLQNYLQMLSPHQEIKQQCQMQKGESNQHLKMPNTQPSQVQYSSNQIIGQTINSFPDKVFEEEAQKEETQRVVPTTFSSMVEFFSYNFQRKEQIKKCKKFNSTQVGQKVNELTSLMNLNSKYTEHSLQKIQKLSNKYGFHQFNLISEAQDKGNNSNTNKSQGQLQQDQSQQNRNRQATQSLSPLKNKLSQNNNTINQVTQINEKYINSKQKLFQNSTKNEDNSINENFDKQANTNLDNQQEKKINQNEQNQIIFEDKNENLNEDNSLIMNQTQRIFQVKSKHNQSQSPTNQPFFNIHFNVKKNPKQKSIDYSNSTQDKTGNMEKFSITLQSSSKKPLQILKKNNRQSSNNVSQENIILQSDLSNKATCFIRNHDSPSRRQLNKLSKILNETEKMKKESFQKFLSANNSPQNISIYSKQQKIKKLQDQGIQTFDNQQSEYKDIHLAEEFNQNNNKIFYMHNPSSQHKRQSNFMNSTLTSIPNKFQSFSQQTSPRNSSSTNFNNYMQEQYKIQKQKVIDNYQSNPILQLNEESGIDQIRNKVQKRQSQKIIPEIPQLLQQLKELQNQEVISARLRDNCLPQLPSQANICNIQALNNILSNTQTKSEIQLISNRDNQKGYLQQGIQKNNIRSLSFFDKSNKQFDTQINLESANRIKKDEHQQQYKQIETKNEQQDKIIQKNLQLLNDKKKQLQFPLQQLSCTNKIQKNNGLQNLFLSGNKKKVHSFYNISNGIVTTPSTVNESLLGTLNTFNIQKNSINPNYNNVQN